jgi:hypothetical protein
VVSERRSTVIEKTRDAVNTKVSINKIDIPSESRDRGRAGDRLICLV